MAKIFLHPLNSVFAMIKLITMEISFFGVQCCSKDNGNGEATIIFVHNDPRVNDLSRSLCSKTPFFHRYSLSKTTKSFDSIEFDRMRLSISDQRRSSDNEFDRYIVHTRTPWTLNDRILQEYQEGDPILNDKVWLMAIAMIAMIIAMIEFDRSRKIFAISENKKNQLLKTYRTPLSQWVPHKIESSKYFFVNVYIVPKSCK